MNRLFEFKKVLATTAAVPTANAQIIFTRAPFIQYKQILLDKNFRQNLETIMVSKDFYVWGLKKHQFKKHTK